MKLTLFLFLGTCLIGCSNSRPINTIEDYSEVEDSISWDDTFDFDGRYLVYYYSEHCAHCKEIKQDILYYYSLQIEKMYFVCTDEYAVFKSGDDLIGVSSIDNLYIFGTPFLIEIKDYIVVNYYAGSKEISEYINMKMQK